jgi:hypothetical protein
MNTLLIILLVGLMIMVVVSLVRGLMALQATRNELDMPGEGATPMQLKQNRMMFARIKYQALAIVLVGVILLFNR